MAQANPTVGDIEGNLALARRLRAEAARPGADLVVLPRAVPGRLSARGSGAEAGLVRPCARRALEQLARDTADGGPAVVMGAPWREPAARSTTPPSCCRAGAIAGRVFKHALPNYGVFDEKRVFAAGPIPGPLRLAAAGRRRHPARGHGLRGHVVRGRGRGAGRERRADPGRAQRLAVRARQAGPAPAAGGGAGHRDRAAAALRQPGRRPGRAGVRRRLVRARRRAAAGGAGAGLRRGR